MARNAPPRGERPAGPRRSSRNGHTLPARVQKIGPVFHLAVKRQIQEIFSLAKIQLQTASGDSSAEIVLEGFLKPDEVRDQLYAKIQRAKNPEAEAPKTPSLPQSDSEEETPTETTAALREIAGELKAIREILQQESGQ